MQNELRVAIDAVLAAARVSQRVFKEAVESHAKRDQSPVTIADFGVQVLINSHILASFPNDQIMAEENSLLLRRNSILADRVLGIANSNSASVLTRQQMLECIDRGNYRGSNASNRFWTLDPIDGTKGFLRGNQYAIALSLIVDGVVQLGVLGCPNLSLSLTDSGDIRRGCLLFAMRGTGAFQQCLESKQVTRLTATAIQTPSKTKICESVESSHTSHSTTAKVSQLLQIPESSKIRMDSQAKYALIARGDAGIYLRVPEPQSPKSSPFGIYRENFWDHAAGTVIVEEAGGVVTDLDGNGLDFSVGRIGGGRLVENRGVVACGRNLHARVLDAVGRIYN